MISQFKIYIEIKKKKGKNSHESSEEEQTSRMYTIRCLNPYYNQNYMVSTQGYTNRETINRLILIPSLDLWQVKLQCSEEIIIFLRNGAGQLYIHMRGKKKRPCSVSYIMNKFQLQVDYRPKCERLGKKKASRI